MLKIEHTHCCYCRRKFSDDNELLSKTQDHYYPSSRLGKNNKENRLSACKECNTWKADMMPEVWLNVVERYFKREWQKGTYKKNHLAQIIGSLRYWIKRMKDAPISAYKYKP